MPTSLSVGILSAGLCSMLSFLRIVSDLYLLIFNAAVTKSEIGYGINGYYFGENGEHSLYVVGKAIAETLVKLGIGSSPEPTTFTKQEIDKYLGVSVFQTFINATE